MELVGDLETEDPIIVLDHQPVDLEAAEELGVDLQLSGHTHGGQFIPFNLVTGLLYEVNYGYYRRGNLQVIVSSGFGVVGPPIRIGTRPEIVEISINFTG